MKEYLLSYNDLNFREEEKSTPPNSLDITPQEASSVPDEKLSKLALKLIRRLLVIADSDYTAISHQDREWLEEMLCGTSLESIAVRSQYSKERIRQRVTAAFDVLTKKVETWEYRLDQRERILKLKYDNMQKEDRIRELEQIVATIKGEVSNLSSVLSAFQEPKPKQVEKRRLDEPTREFLMRTLRYLGIPSQIAKIFANNNILYVIDLVQRSEDQLLEIDGVSDRVILLIKRVLKQNGLHLNSDIRWSTEDNAYYIYITEK